jgi:protein associated with RNAse G/E
VADVVRVRYSKYDGTAHRDYPARRLADDQHGTWLGVDAGTASIYHGQPSVEQIPFVLLIPRDVWWTAMFNPPPRTSEIYCDITSPARWEADHSVHLVDLDLDVVRRRGSGAVELRDEDEFAAHRLSFGYPEEVVAPARAAAAWLRIALHNGTQPFASAYRPFLAQVNGHAA